MANTSPAAVADHVQCTELTAATKAVAHKAHAPALVRSLLLLQWLLFPGWQTPLTFASLIQFQQTV